MLGAGRAHCITPATLLRFTHDPNRAAAGQQPPYFTSNGEIAFLSPSSAVGNSPRNFHLTYHRYPGLLLLAMNLKFPLLFLFDDNLTLIEGFPIQNHNNFLYPAPFPPLFLPFGEQGVGERLQMI